MRDERKRPLPAFPARIGVVTSPRGKAVHDILRTLERRYPAAEVVIAGVQVEGEGAVARDRSRHRGGLGRDPGVDVVILGRGGGSYEDLMPFNSEAVARAVVACPVPVVTGIGHEPDTSIADMVADLRASTPTAAAEAVAPEAADVRRRLARPAAAARPRADAPGERRVAPPEADRAAAGASRPDGVPCREDAGARLCWRTHSGARSRPRSLGRRKRWSTFAAHSADSACNCSHRTRHSSGGSRSALWRLAGSSS